jgi:hypothetical protein
MAKVYWSKIYVDKDPDDIYKGWGWLEIKGEDIKKFNIPTTYPVTYREKLKLLSFEERLKIPGQGNLPRGNGSRKKFHVNLNGEMVTIRAQKALTNKAICYWVKTWAPPNTKIVTPGNRELSLDGEKLNHEIHFIYFIFNQDSNAIKIGRAKNLERRIKSLQTSSPAKLELLKSISVQGMSEAQDLEQSLHKKFDGLRITGEWFRAESILMDYINQLC